MRRQCLCLLFVPALLIMFCSKEEGGNPANPASPNYRAPEVTIEPSSLNGDTLTVDSVTVTLTGNSSLSEFSYNLDNGEFSNFLSDNIITFRYLDDGVHKLTVQTRYESWTDTRTATIQFVVNVLDTPAVMLYPQKSTVDATGKVSIELKTKAFPSCNSFHAVIAGAMIDTVKFADAVKVNSNAKLWQGSTIDFLIDPNGSKIDSSMTVATITVIADSMKDTTTLTIQECTARLIENSVQSDVTINSLRGGI
ncbi:MAG: hypothetical protein GF401_15715, partial [Chitinivibrionales bacterium]|nr:hypothetical protein [Chitinivibrionales bacterium]